MQRHIFVSQTSASQLCISISISVLSPFMASKYHDDWQSSKKTVLQRNTFMFNNELMSDVSFTCEKSSRLFRAHKYVLATSSAVFYAMFYGNLPQQESTICIENAQEKSLEEFLRFLYTDDCEITAENAMGVMYLAKKYLIWPLAEKCGQFLEESISIKPDNVFTVFEEAVQFDIKELEAKCHSYISEKTKECLNSETFCTIRSHTLNALLKKETLAIAEVELFNAVLKWVDSECARQGINIKEDKTARRRILGDSVHEIRFLELSQEDLAKYVSPTGILTDTEIVSIFQKLNGVEVDVVDVASLKWKQGNRQVPGLLSFSRFVGRFAKRTHSGKLDALSLIVNKIVHFHGVRLFGKRDQQYSVEFTIKNETVAGTFASEQDDLRAWGYDVMLPKPIPLLPNEKYTIKVVIEGPPSQIGTSGRSSVEVDDIVVTFEAAPPGVGTNGTNKHRGQFYRIYLSKL